MPLTKTITRSTAYLKDPYCQGIRRIRIGIPGNSANVRREILRYSPEYFRNSDFCPLVARESKSFSKKAFPIGSVFDFFMSVFYLSVF